MDDPWWRNSQEMFAECPCLQQKNKVRWSVQIALRTFQAPLARYKFLFPQPINIVVTHVRKQHGTECTSPPAVY